MLQFKNVHKLTRPQLSSCCATRAAWEHEVCRGARVVQHEDDWGRVRFTKVFHMNYVETHTEKKKPSKQNNTKSKIIKVNQTLFIGNFPVINMLFELFAGK